MSKSTLESMTILELRSFMKEHEVPHLSRDSKAVLLSKAREAQAAYFAPAEAIEVTSEEPMAASDRIEQTRLAREEFDELKTWLSGPEGPRPVTPNLDAVNIRYEMVGTRRPSQPRRAKGAPVMPMNFFKDTQPMPPSKNKLCDLAWHATKNVSHVTPERISTSALRELLAEAGITEPESSAWTLVLSNGVMIGGQPA